MINPKIDYSWVPPELAAFVSTMLGTLLILLVLGVSVAAIWWAASKLSGNFFIAQGRAGIAIITCLLAATFIASLPSIITWGNSINAVPSGISTNASPQSQVQPEFGPDSKLAQEYGADTAQQLGAAQSLTQDALNRFQSAGNKLKHGDIPGAAGDAAQGVSGATQGLWQQLQAAGKIINKQGVTNVLQQGWSAIGKKAGDFWHWITGS